MYDYFAISPILSTKFMLPTFKSSALNFSLNSLSLVNHKALQKYKKKDA